MSMSGNSFDILAHSLLEQKHIMERMERDNRELKQQLADLREGRGIFLVIGESRFALMVDQTTGTVTVTPAPSVVVQQTQDALPTSETIAPEEVEAEVIEETIETEAQPVLPETPVPSPVAVEESIEQAERVPTFLEEIMIDEFAAAATSPMAVWTGAKETPKQLEMTDEAKKAALRRELMGSFLLE